MKRMTLKKTTLSLVAALLAVLPVSRGWPQTPADLSNYIFRFNTGISAVFLSDMTFQKEQPLDLGSCTVNEKIDGPLSCAFNCKNEAVCLLEVSGPSGSGVTDVLEKVSETPVGSSASPPPSGAPAAFGARIPTDPANGATSTSRRIEAYNRGGS